MSRDDDTYTQGGYIPGQGFTWLHPDECLYALADVEAGRDRCSRAGHPTPTSDCATRSEA